VASPEDMLIDKAQLMSLTAPEMTVLLGGLRVLGANYDGSSNGVFTTNPGVLSNDYFVNLLDVRTKWSPTDQSAQWFEGKDRTTGELKWTGTRVDLIIGSNTELRALAEELACDDAQEEFVQKFIATWCKVMNLDRFELD